MSLSRYPLNPKCCRIGQTFGQTFFYEDCICNMCVCVRAPNVRGAEDEVWKWKPPGAFTRPGFLVPFDTWTFERSYETLGQRSDLVEVVRHGDVMWRVPCGSKGTEAERGTWRGRVGIIECLGARVIQCSYLQNVRIYFEDREWGMWKKNCRLCHWMYLSHGRLVNVDILHIIYTPPCPPIPILLWVCNARGQVHRCYRFVADEW